MTLDTNGLGIGTTGPEADLHVIGHSKFNGDSYHSHFNYSSSQHTYIRGGKAGAQVYINDTHNSNVGIAAGGGNVGIGTNSPTAKITLADHTTAAGGIKFRTAASSVSLWSSGSGNLNTDKSFNVGSRLRVVGGNAAADPDIGFSGASSGTGFSRASNDITFITSATERMRINSSGKVLVNGAHDNGGKADFAVDGGTQISLYDGQVQMGGTDMNWNSKFVYDGQTNIAAWDNNIKIFIQGSNTGSASARDIYFCPQTSGTGAATERMRITGAGNVGIGTTSPSNFTGLTFSDPILDVAGPIQSRTGHIALGGISYRKAALFTSTGNDAPYLDFRVATSGTSSSTTARMRINSSGNVGIGTTSPSAKLEVVHSSSAIIKMIRNQNIFGFEASSTSGGGYGVYDYQLNAYDMYFKAGKVGIGTTSPSSTLHIFDSSGPTIRFERSGASKLDFEFGSASTSIACAGELQFRANGGSTNKFIINNSQIQSNAKFLVNTSSGIDVHTSDSGNILLSGNSSATGTPDQFFLRHNLSNVELGNSRGNINITSGNVGIGTTSPSTKLDVSGVITATGGNSTNWNTAYGWGDHGTAGYLTSSSTQSKYLRSDASDSFSGNLTNNGSNHITFGPNSTWAKNLRIGGNGHQGNSTTANIATTNGNLHLDAAVGSYGTYLNYYAGTIGVAFGNGASAAVAWMGPDGDLWKGPGDNSGSKYWHAGNDGSGSGLDADLLDGYNAEEGAVNNSIVKRDGTASIKAFGLSLLRASTARTGITWYNESYYNWQDYMASAGATGCGPNGNLTAPTGLAGVTSWALRSRMEGISTYGWNWETGGSGGGGATATSKMSLNATTGNLEIAGTYSVGSRVGTWITSSSMGDAIGWNTNYGVYIGSNIGGTHYLRGNGTFTTGGNTYNLWHSGNDGSGSNLDADKLDGQQPSQSGGANRIAQYASNGYLNVGNWIHSANGTGIYWPSGLHLYENSGNLHINTSGANYTSVTQGTLWGSSNDGSGSGLDADLLDGVHLNQLDHAEGFKTYSGISASSAQARRHHIGRLYGCPAHWDSNWQNIELNVTSESYESANLRFAIMGDYVGANNQANMLKLYLKEAHGPLVTNFRFVLGTPVDAGWDHSGQNTYYVDLYAEAKHYAQYKINIKTYGHPIYSTNPTSGGAYTVFYNTPTVTNISTFTDEAHSTSKHLHHNIWNSGNMGTGSGLDADLLDNIDSSRFIYGDNATGTTSISGSAFNPTGSLKSGFYRVAGTSSTIPNATTINFALHTSYDTVGNKAGFDLAVNDSTSSKIYFRPSTGGGRGSWQTIWTDSSDGSGSGLDADLLDGLDLHTGRNNEANKVVRTQGNGYLNTGWINTTSGDIGSAIPSRIYTNDNGSGDAYVRYADLSSFRSLMNVSAKATYQGREQSTSDTNYWVGTMGWGTVDFDTIFGYGSGHIDSWGSPSNRPSTETSHWVGHQSMHYTNASSGGHYGHQFLVGAGNPAWCYLRGKWGGTTYSWAKMWNSANDGSGSGLDADKLDAQEGSYYRNASNLNAGTIAAARLSTANTPSLSDNNTNIATTEYVKGQGYVTTDTNTTYSAGTALTLSGTTFNHSDTSSQSSSSNSGRTYIQSINLDGQGHVTGLSTATETVTNTDTNTTYSAGRGLDLSGTQFLLETDLRDSISYIGYDSNDYIHWSNNSYCRTVVAGSERLRVKTDGIDVSGVVVANAIRTKAASTSYSLITRDTGASNYVLYVQSPQSGGTQKIATFGYGSANAGQATEVFRIARGNINVYSANLTVGGTITGTSKNFSIPHPTKEGKRLVHSCIEGPEVAVYFRGRSQSNTIEMPDYWGGLVDLDSMTVELTAIGPNQDLYVEDIADDGEVTVGSNTETALNYFYVVYGERKDIDKLEVEIDDTGEFEGGDGNSEEFE